MLNMKRLVNICLIIASTVLYGCASPVVESRVSSTLKSYEYNDVYATYMPRPTFITIEQFKSTRFLHIKMNEYGNTGTNSLKVKHVAFNITNVDDYITMIDKFLKWESTAQERGDLLEKHIGNVDAVSNLSFDFYSANKERHYLIITTVNGGYRQWDTYYPRNEAETLRQLLVDFKKNKHKEDNSNIYN